MKNEYSIGLVFLGASDFVNSNDLSSSPAFLASYQKIKNYFLHDENYNIKEDNCLDLFNSDLSPDKMDDKLREFLNNIKEKEITDLIFYYVGHGCYHRRQGFILATKSLKDDNKTLSGLLFSNLANRISTSAEKIRTYFLLDCCFSAEATNSFQGTSATSVIEKQFISDFPSKGTTMLCSSSKDLPSIIVIERNITMFTEGLEKALVSGSIALKSRFLTLRELSNVTFNNIKNLNPGNDVRPEIHTPIQPEGDIADRIRLFPNMAILSKPFSIDERAQNIRNSLASNELLIVCNLLMDFGKDFDLQNKHDYEIIILVSNCRDLENEKNNIERAEYLEERKRYYIEILNIIKKIEIQDVY